MQPTARRRGPVSRPERRLLTRIFDAARLVHAGFGPRLEVQATAHSIMLPASPNGHNIRGTARRAYPDRP